MHPCPYSATVNEQHLLSKYSLDRSFILSCDQFLTSTFGTSLTIVLVGGTGLCLPTGGDAEGDAWLLVEVVAPQALW